MWQGEGDAGRCEAAGSNKPEAYSLEYVEAFFRAENHADACRSFAVGACVLEQRIEEVTKANLKFYEAFESLDIAKMDEVWAHLEYVTCVHPGWTLRSDWPSVRDSWVLIFNNTFSMKFELTEVMVQVAGDMAWVICVENITSQQSDEPQQARVLATNIFERIGDEWLMIHHHGSTVMG